MDGWLDPFGRRAAAALLWGSDAGDGAGGAGLLLLVMGEVGGFGGRWLSIAGLGAAAAGTRLGCGRLAHLDQLGEWGCEGTSSIFYRQLHWDATLDRHLVEVACTCVSRVHFFLLTLLNVHHVAIAASVPSARSHIVAIPTIFEIIIVNLLFFDPLSTSPCSGSSIPHFTVHLAIAHIEGAIVVGALNQLIPVIVVAVIFRFGASDLRLGRQDTVFVVQGCRILHIADTAGGSVRRRRSNFDIHFGCEASCHGVHVEIFRLGATEGWYWLLLLELSLEECLGFLASLVLILQRWALLLVTDVLFNHFLLFLIFGVIVALI